MHQHRHSIIELFYNIVLIASNMTVFILTANNEPNEIVV